eukprot:5251258-Prymnesium_polylepis.1
MQASITQPELVRARERAGWPCLSIEALPPHHTVMGQSSIAVSDPTHSADIVTELLLLRVPSRARAEVSFGGRLGFSH